MINTLVSERAFGVVLGIFVAAVALLMWDREHRRPAATPRHPSAPVVVGLGFAVAVASGIVGIGGPMLAVPLLIAFGVPTLESLAAAQVQAIVIAGVGTIGYLAHGAIDWPLAAVVGLPELAGVLLGWRIAHALPTRKLKGALSITLLAPHLILHGQFPRCGQGISAFGAADRGGVQGG